MFATVFFGILEPATGSLIYINGGHEPLFILNPDGGIKTVLNSTAPAIGMLPQQKFTSNQIQIENNEILFAYTDGIPEARASNGEFFTSKRLLSLLKHSPSSATTLLNTVAEEIHNHVKDAEQFDDITLLALRRKEK